MRIVAMIIVLVVIGIGIITSSISTDMDIPAFSYGTTVEISLP